MPDEIEKTPDPKEEKKAKKEVKEKVEEKIEKAVDSGVTPKAAQNIIGEIEKPENPNDKDEVLDYLKQVNEKLDQLIASGKKEEPLKNGKEKSAAWYDQEII